MTEPIESSTGGRLRRWLALAVAVVGCLFVGDRLNRAWPRAVDVRFDLAPSTQALAVDYVQGGDAIKSARFDVTSGDQASLDHRPKLVPGHYEVQVTSYCDGLAVPSQHWIEVPTQDTIVIDLGPAPTP